ncbi:MAG: ribosome small subunit-dependent GTPase A [Bacilli bacterium]
MTGKIIKLISNIWTVKASEKHYNCGSIGKFRHLKISPVVGDNVEFDPENKIIIKVYSRKNELIRPPISNVDQALILVSCKEPEFSSNLLDKMLVVIEYNNIKPIICFTKYDLLKDSLLIDNVISYYRKIGYIVVINNSKSDVISLLENKITVLTGQTGVGKSTLLNTLKEDLNLATGEISKALGRGRHTTRHVELLEIAGGLVADTPGFSSLDFINMGKNDIKDNFIEFYDNQDKCKYQDCIHLKEAGCYIKELVKENIILKSRYDNYKKFIESLDEKRK